MHKRFLRFLEKAGSVRNEVGIHKIIFLNWFLTSEILINEQMHCKKKNSYCFFFVEFLSTNTYLNIPKSRLQWKIMILSLVFLNIHQNKFNLKIRKIYGSGARKKSVFTLN